MKVKKFLKQQAEQDRQNILHEADERFLIETKAKIEANVLTEPHHYAKLKIWLAVTSAILVLIIAFICIFLLFPQKRNKVTYYESNFEKNNSTLQAMDDDMKRFSFNVSDTLYTAKVEKTTDSVSGDVIMYQADIKSIDKLVEMNIVAVCNENYHYGDFQTEGQNFTTKELPLYDIYYSSITIPDLDFGFNTFNAKAKIQRNNEYIYITNYIETMTDEQARFFDIIQSIIV